LPISVNLSTVARTDPKGWFNYGDYPYGLIFRVLSLGVLFLGGGSTDGSNFYPSKKAYICAHTTASNQDNIKKLSFELRQNYPNPFNPSTTISYVIPYSCNVRLEIMDVLGRSAKILENVFKSAGEYTVNFNASTFPSGVYFYRIQAGEFSQTKKMILIK